MHRHELNHLRNRRHEYDDAIHMKGGGWLKKRLHQPLGKRDSAVRSGLRKAEKVIRKEVLPIALPILGGMVGGPVGSAAGGALAGTVRSSHNVGKNMFKGALKGLAIGGGMHLAGQMMGGGLLSGMGGSAPTAGAAGHSAGAQAARGVQQGAGKGFFGSLFGKAAGSAGGGMGGIGGLLGSLGLSPMDALLMGGAALGQLKSKTRPNPEEEKKYNEIVNKPNPHDLIKPHEFSYIRQPNPNYGKARLDPNAPLMGEEAFFDNYLPRQMAGGGYVHGGAIPGNSGGTDDDYDTHIPAGSYVWDSTSTSLLGDGNSENGIKKVKEMRNRFLESGIIKHEHWNPEKVKVKLSPGEIVIEPEVVMALGKGSQKKGVKKLDNARHALRKEKGLTKFLPPKSKSLDKYLRG